MKITVCLGPLCLSFRKSLDLATCRQDPIGMSGTDYGTLRIAECLRDLGHQVTLRTVSAEAGTTWNGLEVIGPDATIPPCDAVIAINEPDLLRAAPPGAFRLAYMLLNDTSFCGVNFQEHVDLFVSPSEAHRHQFMTNPAWHRVHVTREHPNGEQTFVPDPSKWCVVPLGCDPENFGADGWPHLSTAELEELYVADSDDVGPIASRLGLCHEAADWIHSWHTETGLPEDYEYERRKHTKKVSGKVVYCSSPDRGLHWLLQEWPAIKAAVPHATLHIFYRLEPWLRGWDATPHFPPIEPLRSRALYIEECLRRFKAAGGMGVTVRDSVSRDVIEREMASAEVCAYPVDTTTWSEGFSCTILECCAAKACPVVTTCDALGEVYASIDPVPMRNHVIDRVGSPEKWEPSHVVGPTNREPSDWETTDNGYFGIPPADHPPLKQSRVVTWQEVWREKVIKALTDETWRNEQNEKARKLAEGLTWKRTVEELCKQIEARRT